MALIDEVAALKNLPPPDVRKSIREAAGVSLQRMSEELEVEASTVLRWERGQTIPRPKTLIRYVELLTQMRQESTP
jgi:transcriptional regulator with XRE-family HTH domain